MTTVGPGRARSPTPRRASSRSRAGPAWPGREDLLLDARVDRRRRVVEHEQAGAAHEGARDREALALAAGEVGAALAERARRARRAARGRRRRRGRGAGRPTPRRRRGASGSPASASVTLDAHRVLEDERRLRRRARPGRVRSSVRHVAQVDAVEQHRPAVGVRQPAEQGHQRRLARAGDADDGDRAARADVEVDVGRAGRPSRRRTAPSTPTPRISTRAPGPARGQRPACRGRARRSESRTRAIRSKPDQRARQLAEHPAERPHRHGHQRQQVGRRDDVAGLRRRRPACGRCRRRAPAGCRCPAGGR